MVHKTGLKIVRVDGLVIMRGNLLDVVILIDPKIESSLNIQTAGLIGRGVESLEDSIPR